MTLEELAELAVAGEERALETLCRRLQGPIYRLALRMLGSASDAEDAAQEILVLVVTHLSSFEGRSRLLTWVYAIGSRHLLRFRQARLERRTWSIEDVAGAVDAGLAATSPHDLPEGDVRLLARDVRRTCTQAMLLSLSREERLAVILADMLGATDIVGAELCEIAPPAFRQRLARGRAKLRPLLEQRCGLTSPAHVCRCERQAAAKQRAGMQLPVYHDATEAQDAESELLTLGRAGGVFGVDALPAPARDLWTDLRARLPQLLG
jgi:RNA polymerase sigma factor (sigma-70 family)